MFSLLWCLFGILTGVVFGIIPGAGPFLAVATIYPLLFLLDPFNILLFYISLLLTTNYTNSVTSIDYGIPGDAAAVTTARHGHNLFLKGEGHLAVSTNAISSTLGSIFAIGLFLIFLPSIYSIFQFYNSTIQLSIVCLAVLLLTLLAISESILILFCLSKTVKISFLIIGSVVGFVIIFVLISSITKYYYFFLLKL